MSPIMEMGEICNIWFQKCKPSLNMGEKWCPNCDGLGAGFVNISFKQRYVVIRRCYLCEGKGKVDWITAATQKLITPITLSTSNIKEVRLKCPGHLNCKKKLKRLWQRNKDFSKGPFSPEIY